MFGRITLVTSAAFAASLLASVSAYAADTVKPAVLYDLGGKFDKSFNEGVFDGQHGSRRSRRRVPGSRVPTSRSASRTCASSPRTALADHDRRLRLGDRAEEDRAGISQDEIRHIDDVVDLPNVQSVVFKEQEGRSWSG